MSPHFGYIHEPPDRGRKFVRRFLFLNALVDWNTPSAKVLCFEGTVLDSHHAYSTPGSKPTERAVVALSFHSINHVFPPAMGSCLAESTCKRKSTYNHNHKPIQKQLMLEGYSQGLGHCRNRPQQPLRLGSMNEIKRHITAFEGLHQQLDWHWHKRGDLNSDSPVLTL
ncbi:uncharacterized protein BDR25DRAFT_309281 [Lindgomyces ingoldianus]|uniref:Uncharacterized protein n=1 Tax=Lindgomyces ingoldianus TaxID=673940 RepID=A0ACB6RF38_9PLEO|nr:uncharacterized protein BDR25DRAFT_309281 [Lindgomyces ingoldianus]KAF2476947.1 hypothetical protein BDR25DRAFT_309281 [Lindgomyces ingoldianus]